MIKFSNLKKQNSIIKNDLINKISELLERSAFIGGEYVKEFEDKYADYCGAKFCLGVGNGTDALEIAIESLNLPKGSKILVPANSFIATAEAVTRVGLVPVFIPFDNDTFLINSQIVNNYLSPDVSAIIPVHLYGQAVDVASIRKSIGLRDIKIIEDCAQSHGAKYENSNLGSYSDIACYSFYPGKNLGAIGDAGAITTNNFSLYEACRRISNHGRLGKFDHEVIGRNSRLDAIQAIALFLKLDQIDAWTQIRRRNACCYQECLNGYRDIILPLIRDLNEHVFHHFVIRCSRRDELRQFLSDNDVETGIHYPGIIPSFSAYSKHQSDAINNGGNILSIPIAEHLSASEIKHVSKLIIKFYSKH
ncbi:DegT/DnrJ/EryC1/StrS family aminotransferase [Amylibacter sp.]|nr:DegT/DnrJ/EryC1/StrS family aminotransferase [Amylibacter sp.]